jgi:NAD(P)-dependent dehydrogenase (short-subunit alcohol dehydrogenase family)
MSASYLNAVSHLMKLDPTFVNSSACRPRCSASSRQSPEYSIRAYNASSDAGSLRAAIYWWPVAFCIDNTDMSLSDKTVLITGANGGLGMAVTKAFLEAGAQVAGVAKKIQNSDFPHPNFIAYPAELGSADAARAVAASVTAKWGKIEILVHLVGAFAGGKSVADTDDALLERMLEVNLRTAFHMFRAVLPGMRARGAGRILAIGSRTATGPRPMVGAYSASKAALVSLVGTIALENKDRGISANVILPGTMDTPANRVAMPGSDPGKWVQPSQVASLLVHLASDQSSQISGAVIPILGGEL